MDITRRGLASLAAGGAVALARPAIAQNEPLRIGWIAALTGPASAPGIGINRGVIYAAETINRAGGVRGRKIEIITRETQGDPTKAVNAAQEMISQQKVHAVWGPSNSGEALAAVPIVARAKLPNLHPCVVDSLVDLKRFPSTFRISPSGTQWDDATRKYTLQIVKAKRVAVIGDTTGLGVALTKGSVANFARDGAEVVYQTSIDATQPDMMPDMLRARDRGAEAVVIWSVSTGMISRMLNARALMGWNVPFTGHPALGSGEIGGMIDKPANWENCYAVGYRSCSYDASGALPARSQDLVHALSGKIDLRDTLLWWVASGIDGIELVAQAVEAAGSSASEAIVDHWTGLKNHPGHLGTYTFSKTDHNGFPTDEVVMSRASSARNGTFELAPGYT